MEKVDFCFAWNWEYDADFAAMLSSACQIRGISFLQITPLNLDQIIESLAAGNLRFFAFFDRASDADVSYYPLVWWAHHTAQVYLNRFKTARQAWNKAAMHREFIYAGLRAPKIIVLPPYAEQPEIPALDLRPLGDRFAIKPAHGGGGMGVIVEATHWEQVLHARCEYPADQYLLQAHVDPAVLGERQAWFRVIFCLGEIMPCWWDTQTHVYTPLTQEEQNLYGLSPLREISHTIARICKLDLFSTEIAYTPSGQFEIVDYVNDPIDLRLQSKTIEGVPESLVGKITSQMAKYVAHHPLLHPSRPISYPIAG